MNSKSTGRLLIVVVFTLIAGLVLITAPGGGGQAHAAQAVPLADDPEMQARLKRLEYELRCLVCQAESIAESNSEFAQDIRREVARMMTEGMTDQEIRQFLVDRYGDFILFRPPVNSATALLWAGPLLLLAIGAVVIGVILMRRRRPEADAAALSDEEHRRASSLLTVGEGKGEGGR
jgi:cytochrome c-type biogenesis protein CcmH